MGYKEARLFALLWLIQTTRGDLLTGRCVETKTCTHSLLPRALFSFAFFNLRPNGSQRFASELTHLHVQQRRHNGYKWNNEDVCEVQNLTISLGRTRILLNL